MKYLIRTASHENGVTVIDDIAGQSIAKTSSVPEGVSRLKSEVAGMEWYASCLNVPIKNLIKYSYFSENFARVDIKKFAGKQASYKRPFLQNHPYLKQCIKHYINVWPKTDTTPVHGDLTLDNVIFDAEDVRFFDWEHFTTEPHPWGFDMLYCMLSALLLPLPKDKLPSKADYTKFMDLLFVLFEHGLSSDLAEYPLSRYRKIFNTQLCWKEIINRSPHKLFPLKYDELYIDIIDDQITRRIRHKRYDDYKKTVVAGKK